MRIEDFHSITIELFCDFSVRTVLEALLGGDVNEKSLILEHGQLIFEQGNDFNKLFAFDSKFLVHGYVFDNHVCEIVSAGIQLMITAENIFLRKLVDCDVA